MFAAAAASQPSGWTSQEVPPPMAVAVLPGRRACSRFLAVLVSSLVWQLLTGCKPAPPPGGSQAPGLPQETRTQGAAGQPPAASDVAGFLRVVLPSFAHAADVKMDAPIVLPNTSPAQRTWLCSVRFTFVPDEDLLGPAPQAPAQAFQAVIDELAGWAQWQEAYARSPYARLYPAPEWHAPAALAPVGEQPRPLSLLHPAGRPLPPTYAKLRAEWQVDHWQFRVLELDVPEAGEPRASFTAPSVVLGSPEASAFVQAVRAACARAREAQAVIDARYQNELARTAHPGALYKGQLTHRGSVAPVEVRFLPATGGDAQDVSLEVRLPATPGESFLYVARRSAQVPLGPPLPATDAPVAAAPVSALLAALPKGDLRLHLVNASGKDTPYNDTVPVKLLWLSRHEAQPAEVWLHLHDGRLEGRLAGYGTDPVGIVLSATRQPGSP